MSAKERLKGKVTKDSVTLLPCFYFVELPILASSVVSLYFLELTDVFKPVRSGYSCNDRSLSMPYIQPSHEVVTFIMLFSLAFAGPTVTIMIGEGILYCCLTRRKTNGVRSEANINAAGCNFNSYIRRAVRFVGVHIFGLCITALITDVIQLSTGYHAPYFLTVCKPNYTSLNTSCHDSLFIVDDICSGADPAVINAGRKSFPSHHATLAAFAAVYISMYFNATLTDSAKLLKPLLVFSFTICGIICGLTRIIQFKNHAIDVYCGFLIGGGIAVYLGLYAVGNFRPSEDTSRQHPPTAPLLREPPRTTSTVPNLSQDAGSTLAPPPVRHLRPKSAGGNDGVTRRSESLRHPPGVAPVQRESSSLNSLKRASAEVECITPPSPLCKDSLVTFSNTLPRVHGGSLAAMLEEQQYQQHQQQVTRRHASIHASMDSTRSKQLLSQWKSKNESRKLSLQVMETEAGCSPQRSIEPLRCNSEPSAVGLDGELRSGPAAQYMGLDGELRSGPAAQYMGLNGELRGGPVSQYMGLDGELRGGPGCQYMSLDGELRGGPVSQYMGLDGELRGGPASQYMGQYGAPLANHNHGSGGITGGARVSIQSRPGSSQLVHIPEETQENVNNAGGCRDDDDDCSGDTSDGGGGGGNARAKWLRVAEKSASCRTNNQPRIMQVIAMSKQQGLLHGSPKSEGSTVSCTGSIRYKALTDQEPGPAIVRVEAHPENRPVVKPPSTDGSGSWRWKSSERPSLRQSFELNDLNRDSESCESLRDGYGSLDGKRGPPADAELRYPHHPHFHHHHHHQGGITTIRVTPVEGGSEAASSDTQSVASSRDSTLRRKANVILLPDRGCSPDDTARNLPHFFKGPCPTPPPTLTFKE